MENPLLFTICRLERVWGGPTEEELQELWTILRSLQYADWRVWGGPTEEELQEGMFGILNKGLKRK